MVLVRVSQQIQNKRGNRLIHQPDSLGKTNSSNRHFKMKGEEFDLQDIHAKCVVTPEL